MLIASPLPISALTKLDAFFEPQIHVFGWEFAGFGHTLKGNQAGT